jgi:hypothetical protein
MAISFPSCGSIIVIRSMLQELVRKITLELIIVLSLYVAYAVLFECEIVGQNPRCSNPRCSSFI